MRKVYVCFCLAALACLAARQASATNVLDFDALQDQEPIMNYYNGGFGGFGTGPGPNYGVTFESNALAITSEDQGGSGNFTNEPSCCNIMFFLTGTGDVMDVPTGITTGFSFYYSGNTDVGNGTIDIYSGLDGTGTLLASFIADTSLTPLCQTGPAYCVWEPDGVSFNGTAESVVFGGSANYIGWDDITLGSSTPGTPEPGSLILMGTGLLMCGGYLRRRFAR
jgi:PEP-CTERM motif